MDDRFAYRLALSATLERHRDDEGTALLYSFFGKKCIEYPLERAIDEDKLTPYKYYPILVYLSELELESYEQLSYGLFLKADITFNTTIANMNHYKNGFALSNDDMIRATAEEIKVMHTKCMGPDDMISSLSGGNQQKAIFGKWLERSPNIFMMDDPTRGIDVGAKYEIYELIINMAKQGKTIIVVSSEMPEILGITNRIGVMSNGHLAGIVNTKETNQEELLRLSAKYL